MHIRVHNNDRPYPCPYKNICSQTFKTKSQLTDHLLKHTQIKKFVCEKCGQCFARKSRLKIHMMIHTNLKPFLCNICLKRFRERSNFNFHYKKHFKNENEQKTVKNTNKTTKSSNKTLKNGNKSDIIFKNSLFNNNKITKQDKKNIDKNKLNYNYYNSFKKFLDRDLMDEKFSSSNINNGKDLPIFNNNNNNYLFCNNLENNNNLNYFGNFQGYNNLNNDFINPEEKIKSLNDLGIIGLEKKDFNRNINPFENYLTNSFINNNYNFFKDVLDKDINLLNNNYLGEPFDYAINERNFNFI